MQIILKSLREFRTITQLKYMTGIVFLSLYNLQIFTMLHDTSNILMNENKKNEKKKNEIPSDVITTSSVQFVTFLSKVDIWSTISIIVGNPSNPVGNSSLRVLSHTLLFCNLLLLLSQNKQMNLCTVSKQNIRCQTCLNSNIICLK